MAPGLARGMLASGAVGRSGPPRGGSRPLSRVASRSLPRVCWGGPGASVSPGLQLCSLLHDVGRGIESLARGLAPPSLHGRLPRGGSRGWAARVGGRRPRGVRARLSGFVRLALPHGGGVGWSRSGAWLGRRAGGPRGRGRADPRAGAPHSMPLAPEDVKLRLQGSVLGPEVSVRCSVLCVLVRKHDVLPLLLLQDLSVRHAQALRLVLEGLHSGLQDVSLPLHQLQLSGHLVKAVAPFAPDRPLHLRLQASVLLPEVAVLRLHAESGRRRHGPRPQVVDLLPQLEDCLPHHLWVGIVLVQKGQGVVNAVELRGVRQDDVALVSRRRPARPARGASARLEALQVLVREQVEKDARALVLVQAAEEHFDEDRVLFEVPRLRGYVLDVLGGEVPSPPLARVQELGLHGHRVSLVGRHGNLVECLPELSFHALAHYPGLPRRRGGRGHAVQHHGCVRVLDAGRGGRLPRGSRSACEAYNTGFPSRNSKQKLRPLRAIFHGSLKRVQ